MTTARSAGRAGRPLRAAGGAAAARGAAGRAPSGRRRRRGRFRERLTVGVEAVLLERAVSPVLDNAVRHAVVAGDGVGASRPAPRVLLRVADDGAGIAAEDAERVFEPGWRAQPSDGHDGAGLGLALARRLVQAAGGELRVEQARAGRDVRAGPAVPATPAGATGTTGQPASAASGRTGRAPEQGVGALEVAPRSRPRRRRTRRCRAGGTRRPSCSIAVSMPRSK